MFKKVLAYKYPITIGFFIIWILFFDSNSVFFMHSQYQELQDLKKQESFLQEEIEAMNTQKNELFSTTEKLEKYAREQYFFKRDNEDVYVIED